MDPKPEPTTPARDGAAGELRGSLAAADAAPATELLSVPPPPARWGDEPAEELPPGPPGGPDPSGRARPQDDERFRAMPRNADFTGEWQFFDSAQGERINDHLQSYLAILDEHESELQPWFFHHQTAVRRMEERREELVRQHEALQQELATVDEDMETLKKVAETTTQRYESLAQEIEAVRARKGRAERG